MTLTSSQWQNGRRGIDGWGKWTRRRKWYRDAELVEVDEPEPPQQPDAVANANGSALHTQHYSTTSEKMVPSMAVTGSEQTIADDASGKTADDSASLHSTSSKSSFWPASLRRRTTDRPRTSAEKDRSRRLSEATNEPANEQDTSGLGLEVELELQKQGKDGGQWGIGDEARMSLE